MCEILVKFFVRHFGFYIFSSRTKRFSVVPAHLPLELAVPPLSQLIIVDTSDSHSESDQQLFNNS